VWQWYREPTHVGEEEKHRHSSSPWGKRRSTVEEKREGGRLSRLALCANGVVGAAPMVCTPAVWGAKQVAIGVVSQCTLNSVANCAAPTVQLALPALDRVAMGAVYRRPCSWRCRRYGVHTMGRDWCREPVHP
jgi:hypothetical protein